MCRFLKCKVHVRLERLLGMDMAVDPIALSLSLSLSLACTFLLYFTFNFVVVFLLARMMLCFFKITRSGSSL